MGERVVVDPTKAPGDAPGPRGPKEAVPLGYGHAEDKVAGAWRSTAPFREKVDAGAHRLGGWRRVGFAGGLGLCAAGFAYGLADPRQCDAAAFMAGLGALVVGLVAPIRNLDGPGRG